MSLRISLRDHPHRSIAILARSNALVFRHSPSSQSQIQGSSPSSPRCTVEFVSEKNLDLSDYKSLRAGGIHGTLGLINIGTDVFLCVITGASSVAAVRPGENVQRIISVEFYCLNRGDFDQELSIGLNHYDASGISSDVFDYSPGPDHRGDAPLEHPCLALKKLLSQGTFYYSVHFDLTNRLQNRWSEESAFDADSLDGSFLWNSYMIDPLVQFRSRLNPADRVSLDQSQILTSAIRGYAGTITVPAVSSPIRAIESNLPSALTVISRLSCRRAGTRFNARGIDDDGNVANFVETEIIYWFPTGLCFSYAQVRGSVPIFWEQATGLLPQQQKIQITRSLKATQPAFDKHFEYLELKYGLIHGLNLLSESKPGEVELTEKYNFHVGQSPLIQNVSAGEGLDRCLLQVSQFDFHAETKGPGGYEAASMVRHSISNQAEGFAYFLSNIVEEYDSQTRVLLKRPMVILQQEGVFRTNCLDCLDRTNLIQTIISQMAIESFLSHHNEHALPNFWMRHSTLWADNGDALSRIYAGTGALKSSFTRHGKMSLAGAIADARKSATRMYINNFTDKARQNLIDILLGRRVDQSPVQLYDPINDYVMAELSARVNEYTTSESIDIWVGTFNLNGKGRGTKEDLSAWLCPKPYSHQMTAAIVAVGFQEIVELSPQQIMSTDPARRKEWELAVSKTLNDDARLRNSGEYVLLRSGQLVGAALLIFVKSNVLQLIKNVEGSVKKTGLSGIAGNKGAVAIRMDFANTRICFVTAHLAAGFANYDERNKDYQIINHGLRFQRNRSIEDHDTVIWLGDFNYRIGLSDEKVRKHIAAGNLGKLYENDQLHLQMVAGHTFPFFSEAKITFLPTYKYDNNTDDYDTSEKARIPAWCDRILIRGSNLLQIDYTTAPLRFSDHRPVYATFRCTISVIDEPLKASLSEEIYTRRRLTVGEATANNGSNDIYDDDPLGCEAIAPGLPSASSDRKKWWLHNGLLARSFVAEAEKERIPNPQNPVNPFVHSDEPDWIGMPTTLSAETNKVSSVAKPLSPLEVRPAHEDTSQIPPVELRRFSSRDSLVDAPLRRKPTHASSVSLSAVSARKQAPPIPRKPALLASSSQQPGCLQANKNYSQSAGPISGIVPLWETLSQSGDIEDPGSSHDFPQKAPQPVMREAMRSVSSVGTGRLIADPFDIEKPPQLPVRRGNSSLTLNNLMDEDGDRVQSIPSLQPF